VVQVFWLDLEGRSIDSINKNLSPLRDSVSNLGAFSHVNRRLIVEVGVTIA
jgi:hypothetical protein